MYAFEYLRAKSLDFADMHDLGDKLVANGFADPVMDMDKIIYAYGEVASLARELKRSGQTNVMAGRRRGLMSPAAWNAMSTASLDRRDGPSERQV